jgi:hypothetical protein
MSPTLVIGWAAIVTYCIFILCCCLHGARP